MLQNIPGVNAQPSKDLIGSAVTIQGEVVEHLKLGKQEWITILFPNNQKITINTKVCKFDYENR